MNDHEREEVKAALLAIGTQHQGVLNPRDVVAVARDPAHVLHSRFEWDDSRAAEAYRLEQAAALIRRVRVTVIRGDAEQRTINISTTRGYQSRPSMRVRTGGYEAIDVLLSNDDKRRELLAQVMRELQAYRRRYAELSELETVWIAVDEVVSDHTSHSPSAAPDGESQHGATG